MMLAEDLLLLLTDDETGKLAASADEVDLALGGALLAELALTGHVDVAGPAERVREGRSIVRAPGPTGNDLLDEALATVAGKEGTKPQSVVARLRKRTRLRLHERLTEGGVLRAEEGRVLGIFPSHRWPAQDTAHEATVRAELVEALRDGTTGDPRIGALVSLLHALRAVHKVVEPSSVGLSDGELKANAEQIAEGTWVAKAVRAAIDDLNVTYYAAAGHGGFGG